MRGAENNVKNRYLQHHFEPEFEDQESWEDYTLKHAATTFIPVNAKTVANKINSPDVGMAYSLNPYQGCEHGCAYCYARPTHEYWGYSAGKDFEQKILIKENAPLLLTQLLMKPSWKPQTISLSGNTDCYQPIERKMKITRKLLEVFLTFRHPVSIITKNALILRDLDLLKELNKMGLISVALSVTTLNEDLRKMLEPRTSTIAMRLKALQTLSAEGIPCMVMMAPVIPALNSHEILAVAEKAASNGALRMGYTMVRLNHTVQPVFKEWINTHFPDRAAKVLKQIGHTHGGKVNDSRFGTRMKGEGEIAAMIKKQMTVAANRFGLNKPVPVLRKDLFQRPGEQLSLF